MIKIRDLIVNQGLVKSILGVGGASTDDPNWKNLMPYQLVSGFFFDSEFYAYTNGNVYPAAFVLEDGKTYRVKWDGEQRECVAYSFTSGYSFVAIGNGKNIGYPDTGEKFLILYNSTLNTSHLFSEEDVESHYVGIWQKASTSGGGSLPAGIYWSFGEYCQPSNYLQKWFLYNGDLYVMASTASTANDTNNLYKFVDGQWTTVLSKWTLTGFSHPAAKPFIEFGGKIHVFDSGGTGHYIFDGTSFSKKNNCPNTLQGSSAFVQDGKLKVYSYINGTVYVWNETADTWASEATIEAAYSYYYFCNVGNDVYYHKNKDLYKYENGASVKVATLSYAPTHKFEYKSCLYYFYNSGYMTKNDCYTHWCKYDFETGTETIVGLGAYGGTNYGTIVLQDKLYFWHGNPAGTTVVCSMNEVT